jgi:hypothetical protein
MKLRIAGFAGEIPRTTPRLLQDNYAQFAANTKLDNGAITPIRRARYAKTLTIDAVTIYRHGDQWLGWPRLANIAPGPVAGDRLYITGDGLPQLRVGGVDYLLKVPRPSKQVTISWEGEPDPEIFSTVTYAYTNVTAFDEESEPSPLSGEIIWSPGMVVTLGAFDPPDVARRVNRQRIYRSQTSSLGVTTLNFIAERPASTDLFVDNSLEILEPISSVDYNQPPDDLSGIVAGPNGMMSAFVGKDLYFCEPYIPHAWPEKYVLTVDSDIVGLGWIGSSLVIMTKASPYIATGTAPENMTMEKLEVNLPCINALGIVDLGYTIAYPTHSGLVTISTNGANVATEALITRDQWLKMNPYSFKAAQYAGRYMASYNYTDDDGIEQRGTIIIDLSGSTPFIIRNFDYANTMHYHVESGSLYVLSGRDIYEWDALSEPFGEQTWRSKLFVLPSYTNFGAILVEGEDVSSVSQRAKIATAAADIRASNAALIAAGKAGGDMGATAVGVVPLGGSLLASADRDDPAIGITIIADGREVGYVDKINEVVRLPAGFTARAWEIIVRGNVEVTGITLANTPSEIAAG